MPVELTLYRCYWPTAYSYLKRLEIGNFTTESYGLIMTLHTSAAHARSIASLLPYGAVVDIVPITSQTPLTGHEIDDLLITKQDLSAAETKN